MATTFHESVNLKTLKLNTGAEMPVIGGCILFGLPSPASPMRRNRPGDLGRLHARGPVQGERLDFERFEGEQVLPSRCDAMMAITSILRWDTSTSTQPRHIVRPDLRHLCPLTSSRYVGSEESVGAAVRASGIPREEIFVTTKLP